MEKVRLRNYYHRTSEKNIKHSGYQQQPQVEAWESALIKMMGQTENWADLEAKEESEVSLCSKEQGSEQESCSHMHEANYQPYKAFNMPASPPAGRSTICFVIISILTTDSRSQPAEHRPTHNPQMYKIWHLRRSWVQALQFKPLYSTTNSSGGYRSLNSTLITLWQTSVQCISNFLTTSLD